MAHLLALTPFDMGFELRPLCSAGITRPPCSYGPVRHPPRPGLIVTDPPLIPTLEITAMGFPCCVDSPCAHMPSPLPRRNLWVLVSLTSPEMAAFPVIQAGRLPHYPFRGLLSVHSLRPACSPSSRRTLYTKGFRCFVTSTPALVATGWSDSCRVGISPTEKSRLGTAH
jgi:hypothetical protein